MTKISAFLKDEAGAVTVDWVVLTAAVVGLGLLVFTFVRPAVSNLAQGIGKELGDAKTCMEATARKPPASNSFSHRPVWPRESAAILFSAVLFWPGLRGQSTRRSR